MGAGALEETLLGTYYERKLVVSVRLDLANLPNEVNYCTPTQIARQFAADKTLKKIFMAVANMIIHPKSISPDNEICCSSLLIAFGRWVRNAPSEVHRWVYTEFRLLAAEKIVNFHHASAKDRLMPRKAILHSFRTATLQ